MNWFVKCLQNYVTFSGRARRKEYWMFVLFNFLIGFALGFIEGLAGIEKSVLSPLFSLAVLLPGISVAVRRLHDTEKSGWWAWIALLPIVGGIILLVFMCTEGTRGPNRYGPDPKAQPIA